MSKIAVNEITDEVGTGAPAFPNGMSATGAALTDPEITGGIFLGGTGSANKLDDYEEGTFSLTLGTVFSGSVDFSNSLSGTYVKIGQVVNCEISLTSLNGSSGVNVNDRFRLQGLPFSTANDQGGHALAVVHNSYGSGNSSHFGVRTAGDNLLVWCIHKAGAIDYGNFFATKFSYETDS